MHGIGGFDAASMVVFDDGLVVVQGSAVTFVVLGGVVVGGGAEESLANKLAAIDVLGPAVTAAQAAEAAKGSWLILPGEVMNVKIAKSLLQGRKLTIKLSSKTLKLSFAPKTTPVATVVGLLQPLVGTRLEVEPSAL